MRRPAKSSPAVLRIDDDTTHAGWVNWVMGGLLLAAALGAAWKFEVKWVIDLDDPEFNPFILVVAGFGLSGGWFLILAMRDLLRRRRYAGSHVEIDGSTLKPGTKLCGRLFVHGELHPVGGCRIRLQKVEIHEMRSSDAGSITRSVEQVAWEAETMAAATTDMKDGIPFEFHLPERSEAASTVLQGHGISVQSVTSIHIPGIKRVWAHNAAPEAIRWVLRAHAPLRGVDYEACFVLPVED